MVGMNNAPSGIGPYKLDAGIDDLSGLTELSATEYLALPKRFPDEQIFNAPNLLAIGHEWGITLATRGGRIRKIFAEGKPVDQKEAEEMFSEMYAYWLEELGQPTEQSSSRIIWDTKFGNIIIARRDLVSYLTAESRRLASGHKHSSHPREVPPKPFAFARQSRSGF
jgi:hypothetical protein